MKDRAGFDLVLTRLAQYGYEKVELAGYGDRTALELREVLDDLGLRASSAHVGLTDSAAALRTKLENAVTLGQRYVNVPYLYSESLADWQRWADRMNTEAAQARKYGLAYGYHNHAHEFTIDLGGGLTPWEVLTERLDPAPRPPRGGPLLGLHRWREHAPGRPEPLRHRRGPEGPAAGAAVPREGPGRRDRRHVRPRHRRRRLPPDLLHAHASRSTSSRTTPRTSRR